MKNNFFNFFHEIKHLIEIVAKIVLGGQENSNTISNKHFRGSFDKKLRKSMNERKQIDEFIGNFSAEFN
ncbi:hypothetical protein BpHYR1_043669 [Brachionus plicatilis]|uniref:Uncharacterized protein n=1 Tax=Brachionus plicatilis TaxID=10195 RepID=A0A3M7QT54_BRAPC|nr:hypothetical protein BpHYR1_043669 [Brachionus plicatilis]